MSENESPEKVSEGGELDPEVARALAELFELERGADAEE